MALHPTRQFLRAIDDDPTKCILWVGAGLSASDVRQGAKGLPDWHTLMQRMIDDLRDSGSCEPADLESLQGALEHGEYLEIAQTYRQKTRPDQFAAFIKSEIDPPDIVESTVHRTIIDIRFRGIITTNFDRVFERQSDLLDPLVYPQCLDDVNGFRRHGFFAKIHGCIRITPNPAENLVLTEESYQVLRSNPKYQTILRSCIVMHPLLTAGFSLKDPDFLGLIDDLRESLGPSMPTIYSLMQDPGSAAREVWLNRGVKIIPYDNHREIGEFFLDLLKLSAVRHPAPLVPPISKLSEIDFSGLAENWRRARSLGDAMTMLQVHIEQLPSANQQEDFLFRLLANVAQSEELRLAPHFVKLGTKAADDALCRIFERAEKEQSFGSSRPSPNLSPVRAWALKHWQDFTEDGQTNTLKWLIDKEWNEELELMAVFNQLLQSARAGKNPRRLYDIYLVCGSVAGADEAIESIVLSPEFARVEDTGKPWNKSSEQHAQEGVRLEKFRKRVRGKLYGTVKEIVSEAEQIDISLGEESYPDFTLCVSECLLEDFAHLSHLTLHGSSDLYNPRKAVEIVDALASLKTKKCQIAVFWAFHRWPERMRGMISLGDDLTILEGGLLKPLWWRFSSEMRIHYLESRRRPDPHGLLLETGQEFLLNELMGLTYNIDQDFRRAFNASLESFRTSDDEERYEPRPLQELWREQDLNYSMSEDAPPELVRRIAVTRKDWNKLEPASVRWDEARQRAEDALRDGDLTRWVTQERRDFAIDNLLGSYFPSEVKVVFYPRMIAHAAKQLGVDKNALSTVVFIHLTVHAFSHIGRDQDGMHWTTFALPLADAPDSTPSIAHEAIAQYYTFKLLEQLNDATLTSTFITLEKACSDVYRAWRATEHYSLEQMKDALMSVRRATGRWPPVYGMH